MVEETGGEVNRGQVRRCCRRESPGKPADKQTTCLFVFKLYPFNINHKYDLTKGEKVRN